MSAAGKINEARTFRSALLQYSGEFLKALPIPGLGLTMSPNDFRLSVRSYLGMTDQQIFSFTHSNKNAISQSTSISQELEDQTTTQLNSFKKQSTERIITTWLDVKLSISISSLL